MSPTRRFSQALAEGDGISVIVAVDDADAARRAQEEGAEAVVARRGFVAIREATTLPVLCVWEDDAVLQGADACIVDARGEGDHERVERVHAELGEDFEIVLRIVDEEHLEEALEEFDPEVLVLAAPDAESEAALERVLDLLPDVPAGKLAIAEVAVTSREQVVALERAGVDGVIVPAGDVRELVGEAPPEV